MKTAICIGCGCTEKHGCPPQAADVHEIAPLTGCFWLRYNAADFAGVCSECEDLVAEWDKGQREPILWLIAERFYRQVLFLYAEPSSAVAWLRAPQALLGGRTPYDLILVGDLEHVHMVVDQLRTGAFV